MKPLDIAEVAAQSGLPASTLRYYEEIGLIASIGRRGLRRLFGPEILLRLGLIGLGREAGFSLAEIAAMFDRDGAPRLPRGDLHARADAIDRQARELAALSTLLRHVADCPAPSHMACPSFRRLLSAAMHNGRAGAGAPEGTGRPAARRGRPPH
jgi:DNA-binding transcriptional MerR regulator